MGAYHPRPRKRAVVRTQPHIYKLQPELMQQIFALVIHSEKDRLRAGEKSEAKLAIFLTSRRFRAEALAALRRLLRTQGYTAMPSSTLATKNPKSMLKAILSTWGKEQVITGGYQDVDHILIEQSNCVLPLPQMAICKCFRNSISSKLTTVTISMIWSVGFKTSIREHAGMRISTTEHPIHDCIRFVDQLSSVRELRLIWTRGNEHRDVIIRDEVNEWPTKGWEVQSLDEKDMKDATISLLSQGRSFNLMKLVRAAPGFW